MAYSCTAYRVMIASPSDVEGERRVARDVIHEWNAIHSEHHGKVLLPVGWETHAAPVMGKRPQEVINDRVLEGCDLLVAMFWTRLGSPTGEAASGTVEEIQRHLAAKRPAMIYFSSAPVLPDSVDPEQYAELCKFRTWCLKEGLVAKYASIGEFRTEFTRHLAQTVLREDYFRDPGSTFQSEQPEHAPAPKVRHPVVPQLSHMAASLLAEAAEDRSGIIMKVVHYGGAYAQTNGKKFGSEQDPRSRAEWEQAIDDLCALGLLQERGHKGEVFGLTAEGYRIADELRLGPGAP